MKDANSFVAGDAVEETAPRPPNLKGVFVVTGCELVVVDAVDAGVTGENVKGMLEDVAVPNPLKLGVVLDVFSCVNFTFCVLGNKTHFEFAGYGSKWRGRSCTSGATFRETSHTDTRKSASSLLYCYVRPVTLTDARQVRIHLPF